MNEKKTIKDFDIDFESENPVLMDVMKHIASVQLASIADILRNFPLRYNEAAAIMLLLEDKGVIGPLEGTKKRKVNITPDMF